MRRKTFKITAENKALLERAMRTHPKAHARERAYGLLLLAEGLTLKQVAKRLPIQRQGRTISDWADRFEANGLNGLTKSAGSGRKPAFSPSERSGSPPKGRTSAAPAGEAPSRTEPVDA